MIIYCYDSDLNTECTVRSALNSISDYNEFYMNEKFSEIPDSKSHDIMILLDTRIRSRKHNSFAIAEILREKMPNSHIMFMSSHPEDMVHCFKNFIKPSGFVMKPMSEEDFVSLYSGVNTHNKKYVRSRYLSISTHEYKRNIRISDIIYFATCCKKIFCVTTGGEKIEFYDTIANLHKKYKDDFIRCHCGFLVNRNYIKALIKGEIHLLGCDDRIPVSKSYKAQVTKEIGEIQ